MQYEVEQKFRVSDFAQIEQDLSQRGCLIGDPVEQVDCYFRHPARDFAATDEALRIRLSGGQARITYKGPKIDSTTKTRREIELPLGGPDSLLARQQVTELLECLGFSVVAEVRKQRREACWVRSGREIYVALDEVDRVGRFVELELICEAESLDACRSLLQETARELGLCDGERRSYLELLLGPKN